LQNTKNQELKTATGVASAVGTFVKSAKTPEDFVKSYSKPNSYNNMLVAVNHYLDYIGKPRLALKQKPRNIDSLIISPKSAEVIEIVHKVKSDDVRSYLALCATVGQRPQRLLKATWQEIDFENGYVKINERHGRKIYRTNCLHKDVAKMLQALKATATSERVFGFAYKKVATELKTIGTKWRPNNLRDHFYNEGRRHADHDIIDWLMGHKLPGVRANYLADTVKEEYAKFESNFRLS
jgi:integrase